MRLQVFQRLQRRLHGARFRQRALRGLHQRRQAVECFAPGQPPFELRAGGNRPQLPQPERQACVTGLRRQRARDQRRQLIALPRWQHVAEGPRDRSPDEGVGNTLEQRKGRPDADVQHVGLHQSQHRGSHCRDQVTAHREAMGDRLGDRDGCQQHEDRRVHRQQRDGDDTAEQRAGHAAVAAFQRLRQAAAQHHHDGQQDPVVVRSPRQQHGDGVAGCNGQSGPDRMAQRRGVPAPQRQEGAQ